MRRPGKLLTTFAAFLLAAALWQVALSPRARARIHRQTVIESLRSPDPLVRKQAAWSLIERPDPSATKAIVEALLGGEPNPDVREAYVYTLGKLGDTRHLAAIESVIDLDESGLVRAAAWLALARCDPQHLCTLAATHSPSRNGWDQIGIAQGRLYLGDVRDAEVLFDWASAGDASQRLVASRALFKWLRPLLDAAGRWPLEANIAEAEIWPVELVEEIEQRCATLDLQAIADDTRSTSRQASRVRRNVWRLTRARQRLVDLLFRQ